MRQLRGEFRFSICLHQRTRWPSDGHDAPTLAALHGAQNVMHTVRYTEMAPDRFRNFWKDCELLKDETRPTCATPRSRS